MYFFPIEREFEYFLPKPYTNCQIENDSPSASLFNSELFNFISQSKYQYSQQFCFQQCKFTF